MMNLPSTDSILVLGSANMDLTVRGPRLPRPGETVLGGSFYQSPGGKGANQAVAAVRAGGLPVVFLAAVGDDTFGAELRGYYDREGIDCQYLVEIAGEPTGIALIAVDGHGENAISVASGANRRLTPQVVEAVPEEVFRTAKVAIACLESPLDTVRLFLRLARDAGATTILNPAPVPDDPSYVVDQLLAWVDVITPNRPEAEAITGESDPHVAAAVLSSHGARGVITLGAEGCLVVDHKTTQIPGMKQINVVDATGAGDAFNAALAVAIGEGQSLVDAAGWANVAAALSVERPGAGPSFAVRDQIAAACDRAT